MNKLTSSVHTKAADYLKRAGRPLEQALFSFHFEGGSADAVLGELAKFQNPDGGFGHGLECDIRLPDSSTIATSIAFQRLREIHAPADHPLVVNGCRYLRDAYDPARLNWEIIPPNIDDAPHAPWWVYGGDLSHSLSNPRAEIVGYLYDFAVHFPESMRESLTDAVVNHLLAQSDEIEMHDLLCYIRFYETESLPPSVKARLSDKLTALVDHTVARDPAAWREYGLPPLSVVSSPESPFVPLFRDQLPANLDFLIEQQGSDGSWSPNWSWGGLYPEAWDQAAQDWRSLLTLNNLRILKAFGR